MLMQIFEVLKFTARWLMISQLLSERPSDRLIDFDADLRRFVIGPEMSDTNRWHKVT